MMLFVETVQSLKQRKENTRPVDAMLSPVPLVRGCFIWNLNVLYCMLDLHSAASSFLVHCCHLLDIHGNQQAIIY